MSYYFLLKIIDLLTIYIGPILLTLIHWRTIADPIKKTPRYLVWILLFTILHWVLLIVVAFYQWKVGCPRLLGDCYIGDYSTNIDFLKLFVFLNSWIFNLGSLLIVLIQFFKTLKNYFFNDLSR